MEEEEERLGGASMKSCSNLLQLWINQGTTIEGALSYSSQLHHSVLRSS